MKWENTGVSDNPTWRDEQAGKGDAFGYDDANRQVWEDQTLAGYPTYRVQTRRDADGNRYEVGTTGYWFFFDYTQRNQLANIYGGSWNILYHYTYDPSGNVTKRQGHWFGNSTNSQFDALNRTIMSEQTSAGDLAFARSWYQYDKAGREEATWRDEDNGLGAQRGERFSYTAANHLTSVVYNANSAWTANPSNWSSRRDYNYAPDELTWTSINDNGHVPPFTANAMNQYVSINGGTLLYDGNFNLYTLDNWRYDHDADKHLVLATNGSTTASFTYDGLGRCVKRTVNGATTLLIYDEWNPIVELDGAGNRQAWNLYGTQPDEIVMRSHNWYDHLWYHRDRLGNVVALLDDSGNVLEKYSYDAYGWPTITDFWRNPHVDGANRPVSWYGNPFMFTGREWIAALNIYDYRHRMYHPGIGRFLQTDPTGFDAGDMNLFRYCGDDPVDRGDPTGLYAIDTRGLTQDQVKQLQDGQKAVADLVANAASRVDRALEAGADSKEFKSVKEGYEKVNGKGSATGKNLREFSKTARKMETALRDDGTKGYVMTAQSQDWFVKKWNDARVLGDGDVGGKKISINVDKVFKSKSVLRWTIGHESAHNAGMVDYWYKHQPEYHTVMTTQESLENADSYMDFITGR